MNMEIGLLDFQSRGGQNTNFPTHPHHGVPLNHLDFTNFNAGQSSNSNQIEAQNSSSAQGRAQQHGKSSWNLDELMTDLSMVYVSGDTDRLEGDKLQFCTSTCCSSRVKYARIFREKEIHPNPWDREITPSTWDIARQLPNRDMMSGWDLGSDGASTPGSGYNCWSTNTQDSLGVVGTGRMGHLWSGTEFGTLLPSQDYREHGLLDSQFFEDPEKFDSWGGFELAGPVDEQGEVLENKWNRIKKKTKKTTKAAK